MGQDLIHYQFINSQTGNVIAYLSLPSHMDKKQLAQQLEIKRAELATSNRLNLNLIYWQDKDNPIR
ncbi:hypothetical protein BDD43_3025 [Mucilaginibacter gracilis]|uniref:Uncharacterized protein n=1 Tax=Mucilaginibacter gracilis TaxID=423350 RepID=A0A495J1J8_9SPHI|nr:hypothetical protein [Mucilaginibacter gracilis]RKR82835.1 hypothetical protein BDD43_3025 [Mucilaginibacter gracilis]